MDEHLIKPVDEQPLRSDQGLEASIPRPEDSVESQLKMSSKPFHVLGVP